MLATSSSKLQADGWHVKPEFLQSLVESLQEQDGDIVVDSGSSSRAAAGAGSSFTELHAALLDSDLRKAGSRCLPEYINRADTSIKGPFVLQVVSVADVGKPSYVSSGSSRLLLLKLTDGCTTCKALEHQHCSQLTDSILPGTKVLLEQAAVRCGVLLLEPRHLRILGGRVDGLADAWEAQKQFGGTSNRPGLNTDAAGPPAVTAAAPGQAAATRLASGSAASAPTSLLPDDGASAPRFRPFVPGRDNKRAIAAAQQAQKLVSNSDSSSSLVSNKGPGRSSQSVAPTHPKQQQHHQQQQQQPDEQAVHRTVHVAPAKLIDAAIACQQSAAQAKLLDKLQSSQAAAADRGRGGRGGFKGGRGRRGRRGGDGGDDDNEGGGGMTLEEYEAKQKASRASLADSTGPAAAMAGGLNSYGGLGQHHADAQLRSDEDLARQLQAEMDLEDLGCRQQQQHHGHNSNHGQQSGYNSHKPQQRNHQQPHRYSSQQPLSGHMQQRDRPHCNHPHYRDGYASGPGGRRGFNAPGDRWDGKGAAEIGASYRRGGSEHRSSRGSGENPSKGRGH